MGLERDRIMLKAIPNIAGVCQDAKIPGLPWVRPGSHQTSLSCFLSDVGS